MDPMLQQIMAGFNPMNQAMIQFVGVQSLQAQAQAVANIGPLRESAETNSAPQSVKDAYDRILGKLGRS